VVGLLEDLGDPEAAPAAATVAAPARTLSAQASSTSQSSGQDEADGADSTAAADDADGALSPAASMAGAGAGAARPPTVTLVLRDWTGAYAWSAQLRYLPLAAPAAGGDVAAVVATAAALHRCGAQGPRPHVTRVAPVYSRCGWGGEQEPLGRR
jgi:hypothetical protein